LKNKRTKSNTTNLENNIDNDGVLQLIN
jgi:hypothetical protein